MCEWLRSLGADTPKPAAKPAETAADADDSSSERCFSTSEIH